MFWDIIRELLYLSTAICLSLVLLSGAGGCAGAAPQDNASQDLSGSVPSGKEDGSEYNGEDITRPERRVETRFQYRTSSGNESRIDRELMLLRGDWKIDLDRSWKLGLVGQIDLVQRTTTTSDGGDVDREFGTGDSFLQAILAHTIDRNWALGFGARLVAPTAQDALGTGKWQAMPGVGVRYSFLDLRPDTYFVPKLRYAISFGGDPSRRNISQAEFAPTLNIGLPDRWFVVLYPSYDIRINYGDPVSGQTGRLFLPFDFAVGRQINQSMVVSLEAGVPIIKDFPVYNFKTELRVLMRF